tara:strand:+ start:65 stop:622 length:558 start_codon:yes stop_codon:yes gene_type:complete
MKKILIITMCLLTYSGFSQKEGKIKGFLGSEEYNVENESYIKFSFQKHSNENTSYKIKFFQGLGELEFWGHHEDNSEKKDRYFSILTNDYKVDLKGVEIETFYNKVMNNYKTYQKEIRIQKPNVHLDVNLNEEGSFIFSSHMIDLKSYYSFWLYKKKYLINEKDFLKFMTKIRLYYDFKKVDVDK